MNGIQLAEWVKNIVSTLGFSYVLLSPDTLQTMHQAIINSQSETRGIEAPYDQPITDLVAGVSIRPTEMQENIRSRLFPAFFITVQSVAEEEINGYYGDSKNMSQRIKQMVAEKKVPPDLASEAHHWRVIRNVLVHGSGIIRSETVREINALRSKNEISFKQFEIWGPLVIINATVIHNPRHPGSKATAISITAGNNVEVGLGDILASGDVWAEFLRSIKGT